MIKNNINEIKVWDILVRIFHWSLLVFFTIAYLTEDDFLSIHSYAGYSIMLLIGFRLLWGVIGTHYARFSEFLTRPRTSVKYLVQELNGSAKRYIGHNPAGATMVLMLLASLFMTGFLGMSLIATEGHGPLSTTFLSQLPADPLEELHEFFANFSLLLIFVHIAGVLLSSLLHKENLVIAMITGKKEKNL